MENLLNQGYDCFLPLLSVERLRAGKLRVESEVYFPRYLFIQLQCQQGQDGQKAQSWGPIRSTLGVSSLVRFGETAAKIPDEVIQTLRVKTCSEANTEIRSLFNAGDRIHVINGPFSGVEGIFERMTKAPNGEARAMVLIELLSKLTRLPLNADTLRKAQ